MSKGAQHGPVADAFDRIFIGGVEESRHQLIGQDRCFLAGAARAFDAFGRIVGHRLFFNECLKEGGGSRQLTAIG